MTDMVIGNPVAKSQPDRVEVKVAEREPLHPLRALSNGGEEWIDALCEAPRHTVLLVDEFDLNLDPLRGLLENDGYRVLTARRGSDALEILEHSPVDLIILDRLLPDMNGAEFCRRIRANRCTELIPILMLSCVHAIEHEIAGIGAGADGFLARPFHPEVMGARVRSMLRHKAMVDRLEESETILLALAQAVELRDPSLAGHCDRMAALCVAMGMAMNLPSSHLLALHRGGYLHDIGKIGMPDSVLFKKGPLNESEWTVMRTHTTKGEAICRPMKSLSAVLPIIRNHHERWDGSGYPDGLAGQSIPLLGRVLQLADIYDALTATRCYKIAMSPPEALRIMEEETSRGWHDPELMRMFLRLRHDAVREAAERNAEQWQDLQVMHESLENLRSSILRF